VFDDGGVTMAHIRKYRDLEALTRVHLAPMRVGGEWRGILRNSMGGMAYDTGWFPNTILDVGLTQLGQQTVPFSRFHIGDSSTAVNVTQTALLGWLAQSGTAAASDVNATSGSPNYILDTIRAKRFDAGVGTGTVREFGAGYSSSNVNLTVRSLVSPEFVKASDQILDVYYRFYVYPDLTDATGQITITEDGTPVTYDYTSRGSELDSVTAIAAMQTMRPFASANSHQAYSGNISTITGSPAGTPYSCEAAPTVDTYGQGYCDYHCIWNVNQGNTGSGIRSVKSGFYQASSLGAQVQYSNASGGATIPKDNTKKLTLNFRRTWARHV
jgi:hypothetical protein